MNIKMLATIQTNFLNLIRKGSIVMKNAELLNSRNFVTPTEFCEICDNQVSVTTVNLLIRQGKIPCCKMGRKNLIPVSYVRELLATGTNKGAI